MCVRMHVYRERYVGGDVHTYRQTDSTHAHTHTCMHACIQVQRYIRSIRIDAYTDQLYAYIHVHTCMCACRSSATFEIHAYMHVHKNYTCMFICMHTCVHTGPALHSADRAGRILAGGSRSAEQDWNRRRLYV